MLGYGLPIIMNRDFKRRVSPESLSWRNRTRNQWAYLITHCPKRVRTNLSVKSLPASSFISWSYYRLEEKTYQFSRLISGITHLIDTKKTSKFPYRSWSFRNGDLEIINPEKKSLMTPLPLHESELWL